MVLAVVVCVAPAFAAPRTLEAAVVGVWRSEDLGLDFPIWMVDTYAADGTVRTDFYSEPDGEEIHHADRTTFGRWRIRDNALEVGTVDATGAFKRDGRPRPIKTDAAGRVTSIGGWTRVAPAAAAATQPTSKPSPSDSR